MLIDENTYHLKELNYIKEETPKKQIILGHTSNSKMRHFSGWEKRYNGKYKETAHYTINSEGVIYKHFEPIYTSNFFGNIEIDKKSIIVLIENDGWLLKDIAKNVFINWIGHIYNKPEQVVEKRWRGYTYWAPYTENQVESALNLITELCDEFYISKIAVPHNTKIDEVDRLSGVLYRSNLEKYYTDLSPAWNFEGFKYKLENQ